MSTGWTVPLLLLLALGQHAHAQRVTGVSPATGSRNGGVRITVHGTGFADSFDLNGDPNVGTHTKLVAGSEYPCDLHVDGVTTTTATCYTRAMPEGEYQVKVTVDGVDVTDHCSSTPSDCQFTVTDSVTPKINTLTPRSGVPGTLLTADAKMFTSRYGSNLDSQNSRTEKITKFWAAGRICDVKDIATDQFYGLNLYNDSDGVAHDDGYFKCKPDNDYIGNYNISFLVEGEYGRSMPDPTLLHVHTNGIGMYQMYTEISGLSANSGSQKGGLMLTVSGQHFDDTDSPPRVVIGDLECLVQTPISSTAIICQTPADPTSTPAVHTGNRGLTLTVVNGTTDYTSTNWASGATSRVDEAYYETVNYTNHVTKLEGVFVVPEDGTYRFYLKSSSNSQMTLTDPVTATELVSVTSSSWARNGAESSSVTLVKDEMYQLSVLSGSSGDSGVEVTARHYETQYTSTMTGAAIAETQELVFDSVVQAEVQRLDVTAPGSTVTGSGEVQVITVDGDLTDSFIVAFDGAYTEPLTVDSTDYEALATALNALPSLDGQTVTVSNTETGTSRTYTVTFPAALGDVDEMTGQAARAAGQLTVSVSTSSQGEATLEYFRLEFGGAISSPLSTTASTRQVKSALEEMAGVRCHSKLSSGKMLMDCESTDLCAGTRTGDEEPFCGRFSAMNPGRLYSKGEDEGYYLDSSSSTLCLGHKGPVTSVWVRFLYHDSPDVLSDYISFSITVPTSQMTKWRYTCEDIYSLVRAKQPSKVAYQIDKVGINRDSSSDHDTFIDHVVLNRATTVSDVNIAPKMRMPQARPNSAFIRGVDVTGSAGDYTVEVDPFLCGNTFGLITVPLASVSGGTGSGSNQATFSVSSGGQTLRVKNSRQNQASKPIADSFTVTFNGQTSQAISVVPDLEVETVRDTLSLIQGLGDVDVTHDGDCKAFTYTVAMATKAGDQPELVIDFSRLTGNTVTTSVQTVQHGSLWYRPIPGDMLHTVHALPQVKMNINNVPTSCASGVDCSFTWTTANTPTITAITPLTGGQGTVVTITGTGFDGSGDVVTVGGADCSVSSASATSLQCTMSVGPNGPQPVMVLVPSKGLASGSLTFTFTSSVSSLSPTTGSLEGGFDLAISGQGFASDATVTVGGATCDVTSASVLELVCTVPPTATGSAGAVSVIVTQGSTVLTSPVDFSYSSGQTPVVSAISVTSVNAWGGDTIGIDGSGFGSNTPYVTVNGVALTVTSNNDARVEAEFPPLPPGSYPLQLRVNGKGLADVRTNSISDITVTLKVTGLTPTQGSMYGGTVLTVSGQGFGTNTSRVEVTLGGHGCTVDALTGTELTCTLDYTGTTHAVTNQGTHKDYGKGFAYDHKQLSITEGDCVRWSWTTPSFVAGIAYGIYQTATDTDKVTMPGGFASSVHAANGQYEFCFNVPGTYFYWSGDVNAPYNTIYLRGQVTVTQRQSSLVDLKVKVGGVEAEHDTVSGSSPSTSGSCSGDVSLLAGCVAVNDVSPNNSSIFQYVLHECATPTVTAISHTEGTTMDTLTFTGTGFGLTDCQNEVMYGGVAAGVVSSSSDSLLSFSVSEQGPPPVALLEEFTVRVGNRGNALIAISSDADRRFALLPVISSISPYKGSLGGATLVTITGSGFAPNVTDVEVMIDSYKYCTVQTATTTEVTCLTPSSSSAKQASLEMKTYHGGNALPVACHASFCSFLYDNAVTATLTSVTPTSLSAAATTLTISGSGFGSTVSDVSVTLGGAPCTVSTVISTEVVCSTGDIPAGTHIPQVAVSGKGLATADSTHAVDSQALVSSITPTDGSVHGGTMLTIVGHGFKATSTVSVDGSACSVVSETGTTVVCLTVAHAAETVSAVVTSNGVTFPSTNFTFSTAATPTVSSVSPASGQAGDSVVIMGTGFSANTSVNNVDIGGVTATVTAATTTSLTVTLGNQNTGTFAIAVDVTGFGLSNDDITFEYTLGNVDISPTTGTTAGGQTLTVTGSGFLPGSTDVTVCGVTCPPVNGSTTATQILCVTPANAVSVSTPCSVEVTVNSVTKTAVSQYTYDPSVTPEITDVTPTRGGTAGGTLVTITGSGFGISKPDVAVTVGGSTCDVQTVTDTQITCTTNSAASGNYQVDVNVNGMGSALQTSADFQFIDVWTSSFTWGGNSPPVAGDLVVVPPGQILLLDNSTERLAMLLIQGTLIFDEMDLELHADNILITDGGALQVGTEANPFPEQYTALIKLYGHLKSKELPIYGTKVLALREGTLDLHGRPTPVTWTLLETTANAGDTSLTLTTPVNWKVGDEIVIPSTSHRHSQVQNEVNVISAVSPDGLTLTLRDPLAYKHVVVQQTMQDSSVITLRGEVGLLSHNVKVMGSVNDEWTEDIPACPEGFDTGEFATQTCFQGRFGAETGSDQFGAHIIAHAPTPDTQAAVIRLSYIEISHAGQAFRLGRYPVHLHLNGDMSGSYVRGLGIHNSFNRAVNVHGTHNALVEHVVLYNIMGGAFFLEDGIETNNTFQYNLGVFVKPSSSLRNDDITPATFWVTNPDNIIIHNHAAGGSHFGFWYRMHDHPEGPSFDASVCPKNVPLSRFENNTAHSFGWFGLWIFEDMFPTVGGACSGSSQVSVFKTLTAWNCEKGAEAVNSGALQFKDFLLVNNEKAGYEGKEVFNTPQYDEVNGPLVDGGKIIASLSGLDQEGGRQCTKAGIVLPYQNGFMVVNVKFYNFDRAGCAAFEFTRISGTCIIYCGGFTYHTKGLQFENTNNKVHYEWESEGVLKDLDGTLTGSAGSSVIPTTPTLPSGSCTDNVAEMSVTGVPGSVCDSTVKFHRFAFMNPVPSSVLFKDALFTNQYGTSRSPFADKRITHKPGWVFVLVSGECYEMEFDNAGHISNVSYDGAYYQFDVGDALCITQRAERPDRVFMDGSTHINMSDPLPTPANAQHGDWYYDEVNGKLSYYVKRMSKRKKRGAILYDNDLKVDFRAFRCYYDNCIPPPDPIAVTVTPGNGIPWSAVSSWDFRNGSKPVQGDNVTIPIDKWLIIDEDIPQLDFLIIEGGVSVAPDASLTFTLDVNYIVVSGRLSIGWESEPFNGSARIVLRGDHSTPKFPVSNGPEFGAKFIGVLGGLDLHGVKPSVTWSRLAATASSGDRTLTLEDSVTWAVGDEVMLTTTDLSAWHTETFRLTNVAGNVITLNSSVQHGHIAHSETLSSGYNLKLTARVALLTRNIVIEGASYTDMEKESFGARVIVGKAVYNGVPRSGFARVENVEFYHTGQEGYTEPYDPRYSLAFVDTLSDNTTNFYSYVRNNAFHNGFSPAVGVFAVDNLEVSGNVIHHTVYHAIHTTSTGTRVEGNLMALNIFSGTYQDRYEVMNYHVDAAVEAVEARDLVMKDNIVSGSERAAYHLMGQPCSTPSAAMWSNNEGHSCLTGVGIFPDDTPVDSTCYLWAGFIVWKSGDWGFYIENSPSVQYKNIVAAENGASVMTHVIGPDAVSHTTGDKSVDISDSTFIGRTTSFDCSLDIMDSSDDCVALSGQARGWRYGSCGMAGILFPNFLGGDNQAPKKPWAGIMAYNTINGIMRVNNVHFEHFKSDGAGSTDFAISTNKKNDDLQHPIHVSGLSFHDVDNTSKVFYHNPNVGKINPSDCVDMDCDALKKAMVKDTDGSLLGAPGYVIPNSAYEWDGDARHGLGDHRIPKALLNAPDGSRIPVATKCPYKGIYNHGNCTWMSTWNAYQCDDSVDYGMLTIESMDADTETRRLSPVAVYSGGYVDLINGPQDHGWCSGYTCRKRLSTFHAIVPLDRWVDIYLSSTVPQQMRFMLLNAAPTDCVGLSIFKKQPHRLDVYVDGTYIMPLNAYMSGGRFYVETEDYPDQYKPVLANKTMGDNYIHFETNTLYWMQCGPGVMEFRTAEVLIVSIGMPAMSNEEFFGEEIVNNLAQFLSITMDKIRVVDVIRETGSSGRRKRTTGTTYFIIEVGDTAADNSSTVDLVAAADQIVTQVQLYGIDDIINATVLYTSILEPSAGPEATFSSLQRVGTLIMTSHPVGGKEGQAFITQPQLQVQDTNGAAVDYLGALDTPWQVEVSISSGGGGLASMIGNTSVTFVNGTADFSGLGIDRSGNYILDFNITHPVEAANYSLQSLTVSVLGRNVRTEGELLSTNRIVNTPLSLTFRLVDIDTGDNITAIDWRDHTWTATATISDPDAYPGSLGGTTSVSFDPATGSGDFLDLQLTRSGVCPVLVTVTSSPSDYTLTTELEVDVMTVAQRDLVKEETSTIELKFDMTYNATDAPYHAAQVRNYYSENTDMVIESHSYRQGSLVVSMVVSGTTSGVNTTLYAICDNISNGTTFTFSGQAVSMSTYMTYNGQTFYGVTCGSVADDDDDLHPGIIAAIVIVSVALLLLAGVVVLWYFKIYPKTKTTDTSAGHYLGQRNDPIEDILFREDTFMSLKSRSVNTPMPPVTTTLGFLKDELPPMPGTPEPSARGPRPLTPNSVSPLPQSQDSNRLTLAGPSPSMKRPLWR